MAKVYMFPEKKKLPANLEKRLKELSKEYMEVVYAIAVLFEVEDPDQPEYMELMELIAEAFGEGVAEAMTEINEEL